MRLVTALDITAIIALRIHLLSSRHFDVSLLSNCQDSFSEFHEIKEPAPLSRSLYPLSRLVVHSYLLRIDPPNLPTHNYAYQFCIRGFFPHITAIGTDSEPFASHRGHRLSFASGSRGSQRLPEFARRRVQFIQQKRGRYGHGWPRSGTNLVCF